MKIKVLQVYNSLMPSGAETMWVAASDYLRKNEVETHVLATALELGPYHKNMEAVGFAVHHLPHRQGNFIDFSYWFSLFKFIKYEKFDSVQIHPEAWRLTNTIVARISGVKNIVTTVHSNFSTRGLRRFLRICRMKIIEVFGAKIVAISEGVMENERSYSIHPILIWNWFDNNRFLFDESKLKSKCIKERIIISVGNCSCVKNHKFLFKMFSHLPKNYRIIHVGKEDAGKSERKLARALGILDRVEFLGARLDVPDLLRRADLYVMTSSVEGFGVSCLEALALGLPAVVSDIPGLRDIATRIPLCFSVPLEAEIFANKIVEVMEMDEEKLNMYRKETHKCITDVFSLEHNVSQYLALWRGV